MVGTLNTMNISTHEMTNGSKLITEEDVELVSCAKRNSKTKSSLLTLDKYYETLLDSIDYDRNDQTIWQYSCNVCCKKIKRNRYFCIYCEEVGTKFQLCLFCFQCRFPAHQHPRSSFAARAVLPIDPSIAHKSLKHTLDLFDAALENTNPLQAT